MSYGVNRSSLFPLFLLQNFMNIDGMTLILFFLSPPFSAGPQKPRTLTASKIKCEIFKKPFIAKITLVLMIKKMPLSFSKLKK